MPCSKRIWKCKRFGKPVKPSWWAMNSSCCSARRRADTSCSSSTAPPCASGAQLYCTSMRLPSRWRSSTAPRATSSTSCRATQSRTWRAASMGVPSWNSGSSCVTAWPGPSSPCKPPMALARGFRYRTTPSWSVPMTAAGSACSSASASAMRCACAACSTTPVAWRMRHMRAARHWQASSTASPMARARHSASSSAVMRHPAGGKYGTWFSFATCAMRQGADTC
ncbi:hypothetical protein D3C87_1231130 [compost metagenome]